MGKSARFLGLLFTALLILLCRSFGGCTGTDTVTGSSSGTGASGGSGSTGTSGGSTGGGTGGGGTGTVSGSGNFTVTNGFSSQALTVDGLSRQVSLLAPAGRGATPPLVIAFHGTSGGPEDWVDADAGSDPQGLEALANANGFLIAAPKARDWGDGASDWDNHSGNDRYWETRFDANPSCGSDPTCNADLVLVQQIISAAHSAYNVDLKRVYLIGFSNGAFFAELAALALNNQIAAFAEAAGGLVKCDRTDGCTAQTSSTTCDAALGAACSCGGAEKPIAIPISGRKVPGLMGHHNHDDTVSAFYTCALSARLQALVYDSSAIITAESGHGIPTGFIDAAWNFFASRTLP